MTGLERVVVLAGGSGGAKLAEGMQQILGEGVSVIANTADDVEILGADVSPDPDLVTYWLCGQIDEAKGYGLKGDTTTVFDRMVGLGAPDWFHLSDRDFATCLYRRAFVHEGGTRTGAQAQIARALGVKAQRAADERAAGSHPGQDRRRRRAASSSSWSPSGRSPT